MNHEELWNVLMFIRPNAEFVLRGNELEWLDKNQTEPTQTEIDAGWIAYQNAQAAKTEAKAQAKAALLAQLGITEEEAKLLLS